MVRAMAKTSTTAEQDDAISEEAREIGERIRRARDRFRLPDGSKMTNEMLGTAIGVTGNAVKKILDGTSATQYAKLKRLASILRTSPNELLGVSDGSDLDEVFAGMETALGMVGFDQHEAKQLALLVREAVEEPLTQSSRQNPILARRILVEAAIQRFFSAVRRKDPDA